MQFIRLFVLLALIATPAIASAQEDSESEAAEQTEPSDEASADEEQAEVAEAPEPATAKPASRLAVDPGADLLMNENAGRARTNRIGAAVIGAWALGNFGWATVGLLGEPDDRARGFHLTNAAVNLVVAGVAVGTYFSNVPDQAWEDYGAVETLNEAHSTEKLYLLASGLDVAYIMTGAFLTAKGSIQPENEGMIGTGRSLMLQGAFLFAFDATMFTVHMLRRAKFVRQLVGGE